MHPFIKHHMRYEKARNLSINKGYVMTRKQIDDYIKENTVDHVNTIIMSSAIEGYPSNFGTGQHSMDIIRKMAKVGKEMNIQFTFARKITALDEFTWSEKVLEAKDDWLFAILVDHRDLTDFWKRVDKAKI